MIIIRCVINIPILDLQIISFVLFIASLARVGTVGTGELIVTIVLM